MKFRLFSIVAAVAVVFASCEELNKYIPQEPGTKEEEEDNKGNEEQKLEVVTLQASDISSSAATVSASYVWSGADYRDIVAGFRYGTSEQTPDKYEEAQTGKTGFSAELTGLEPQTTYYYFAVAEYDGKELKGETLSFTTEKGEDPEPGPGPEPQPSSKYHAFFELPQIADTDGNGVDDADNTLYYAQHFFTMGNKEYRNYTLCYSGQHHCPVWVAAPRHDMYTGTTGRTEAYRPDPDIPEDIQYTTKSVGSSGCNKGHMLGSAERTCCREANEQVFYYSNIAPQLSAGFNTGGGGWNILEDYVDAQVCSDTLYVVIGCYFERFTDGYGNYVEPKTISYCGRNDVTQPTMQYYLLLRTKKGNSGKSVRNCTADELQCAAFVRSHTNSLKGQKVTSKDLMTVEELENVTGFKYFTNVPNAPKSSFNASDWGL